MLPQQELVLCSAHTLLPLTAAPREQGLCKLVAFLFGEGVGWPRSQDITGTQVMCPDLLIGLESCFITSRRQLGPQAVLRLSVLTQLINTGLVRSSWKAKNPCLVFLLKLKLAVINS